MTVWICCKVFCLLIFYCSRNNQFWAFINHHLAYSLCSSALLVRDPSRRISFERFFAHPFVNLAKSSSKDELEKADAFVAKARQAEASSVSLKFSNENNMFLVLLLANTYFESSVQISLG